MEARAHILPCLISLIFFVSLVGALNASVQASNSSKAIFSSYVVVDASRPQIVYSSGEPSIYIDGSSGDLFVSAIAPTQLYESTNGGSSFSYMSLPYGTWNQSGSDAHIITDNAGEIYALDQIGSQCVFFMKSSDGGKTFSTMTDFGNGTFSSGTSKICTGKFNNAIDRPWLASYGSRVYIVYNAGTGAGGTAIDVSADGGLTFSHKLAVPSSECDCGGSSTPLTVDPSDGALYIPYVTWGSTSLKVAVSTDGGSTFNYHTIVQMPSMNTSALALGGFPSIAIDKEGNLYAVWSDNSAGNYNVYMSVSKDKGVSWGTPIKVNAQPGQHFKPWAVAGNAGNVAVAWYGTNDSGTSPWNAPNARWYVHVSVSLDALANQPSFQESTVANVPFHIGSICSHTYTCADTNDSNGEHKLADFFQITIDKDGRLNVVWTDTAQYNGTTAHIFFSRQISGPNILGKSTSMTSNQSTSSTTQTITSATTSGSSLMSSITTIYTQQPQQPQNNGILMFALVIIIVLIIAVAYFYRLSHKTF